MLKDSILKKSVSGPVLYPEEISGIVLCLVFMSFLKENFSMWVSIGSLVGYILIALWVSESTGVTHLNPVVGYIAMDAWKTMTSVPVLINHVVLL